MHGHKSFYFCVQGCIFVSTSIDGLSNLIILLCQFDRRCHLPIWEEQPCNIAKLNNVYLNSDKQKSIEFKHIKPFEEIFLLVFWPTCKNWIFLPLSNEGKKRKIQSNAFATRERTGPYTFALPYIWIEDSKWPGYIWFKNSSILSF